MRPSSRRQVRHDPHLDLAVVGRHQLGVAVADHEPVADLAAGLGADRDVLQVRLGGRQPAGRRDRLVERGVDAAVGGHRVQQPVDGDLEPGGVAVGQQVLQERVPGLVEQRLQRIGVGGVAGLGALGLRHLQLVEQHHLQLLRRAEVDLLADHGVGGLGGVADLVGELALQLRSAGRGRRRCPWPPARPAPAAPAAPSRRAAPRSRCGPVPRRARRRGRPPRGPAGSASAPPGRRRRRRRRAAKVVAAQDVSARSSRCR